MPETDPYLSLVVTARNDNHGGSLLTRMQAFINGWIGQCQRHGLSSELIVVDWNPPAGRPPLVEALHWPLDTCPCTVRFIQVPADVHRLYKHAEALPLYQMIAKNVGIRRARGAFVLATNIDIIFSDELVSYLAQRTLEAYTMYRIDRHDIMSDVPVEATVEEQLAYCQTHLIRINVREGTFSLTPDGLWALSDTDIAPPDSGIAFGRGWYAVEQDGERVVRWLGNDAEVMVKASSALAPFLVFDLEPGPGAGGRPVVIRAVESDGKVLAEIEADKRMRFPVPISALDGAVRSLRLRVSGGGLVGARDPRALNVKAFSCKWATAGDLEVELASATVEAAVQPDNLWTKLMRLIAHVAEEESSLRLPVPPPLRRCAQFYCGVGGLTGLFRGGLQRYRESRSAMEIPPSTIGEEITISEGLPSSSTLAKYLHTNACGDFTLMAREHWLDLRGYPEFDMYSFHLDSVFCYVAYYAGIRETILAEPMRIYHIEHGIGSGWTPEGQQLLFERLRSKGIAFFDYQQLLDWADQMSRLNCPFIFNRANWGLADLALEETVVGGKNRA